MILGAVDGSVLQPASEEEARSPGVVDLEAIVAEVLDARAGVLGDHVPSGEIRPGVPSRSPDGHRKGEQAGR